MSEQIDRWKTVPNIKDSIADKQTKREIVRDKRIDGPLGACILCPEEIFINYMWERAG